MAIQSDLNVDQNPSTSTRKDGTKADIQYALPQPSLKPILIFLACLVVIVGVGLTFMDLTGNTANQKAPRVNIPFKSMSGNELLQPIIQSDEPPSNILGSLAFPLNTTIVSQHVGTTNQYDANLNLESSQISSGKLFANLSTILKLYRWKIITNQIQNTNDLLIASLAGNDGFFWTVGFTIPIVQNTSGKYLTQYKMSLFQQSDGG